jgi:uncharacterized membrane protein (UPF0127 family)
MQARRLSRLPRTEALGREVALARGLRARLLGLALLPRDRAGAGLLIPGCRSVHTFGMRFEIDIVFLARDGRPLRRIGAVPRGRIVACPGANAVLELPSHKCAPETRG